MTGAMARTKGQAGEREAAHQLALLTGRDVRRRVRNHAGDSDLEGLPGWSLEIKRHATARPGEIAAWWSQTVAQALRGGGKPLLMYRADHASWRCVWPQGQRTTLSPSARLMIWSSPIFWRAR